MRVLRGLEWWETIAAWRVNFRSWGPRRKLKGREFMILGWQGCQVWVVLVDVGVGCYLLFVRQLHYGFAGFTRYLVTNPAREARWLAPLCTYSTTLAFASRREVCARVSSPFSTFRIRDPPCTSPRQYMLMSFPGLTNAPAQELIGSTLRMLGSSMFRASIPTFTRGKFHPHQLLRFL